MTWLSTIWKYTLFITAAQHSYLFHSTNVSHQAADIAKVCPCHTGWEKKQYKQIKRVMDIKEQQQQWQQYGP